MKRIQKRLHSWLAAIPLLAGLLGAQLFLTPVLTYAAPVCSPSDTSGCTSSNCSTSGGTWENPFPGTTHPETCVFSENTNSGASGGTTDSSLTATTAVPDEAVAGGNCKDIQHCDLFVHYINPAINLLAAAVGIIVAISIIIGGLQYGSSAGDPQKASAAKNRIRNAIIALVTFLFLYAILNFLIPGGLLNL
jgi:hypothetical protein